MEKIGPPVFITRSYYSFQNQEAQLSYKLHEVHNNIQLLQEGINNQKININKQKEFNQIIQQKIKEKQTKVSKYHQTCLNLDQEINYSKEYLQNLNQSISQLKKHLDKDLQTYLYVNFNSNPLKLQHQYIQNIILEDLMGSKCKFTPYVTNYSWQIEVEKHDQQLYIWKTNDQPSYIFAYNFHPLQSKGIMHFSLSVQFTYQPKFLIGVTNHKNISQNSSFIYFNSQTMQIQKNGQAIRKVQGQIKNLSKVTFIINCDVWLFFIVVDQVLLCQAELTQMKDQYIYFFIGLTSTNTILKFDHSTT